MAITYITSSDITDDVVKALSAAVTARVATIEDDVNDLAERKGITSSEIYTTTIHHMIKRWCVAVVCRDICLDKMGVNNLEMASEDKYKVKYDTYRNLVSQYESQITPEILTGSVAGARTRSTGVGRLLAG